MSKYFDWQQRVIEEKEELDKKLKSLSNYLYETKSEADKLRQDAKGDLVRQLSIMEQYQAILGLRISKFNYPEGE